jgi:hypothetical protein
MGVAGGGFCVLGEKKSTPQYVILSDSEESAGCGSYTSLSDYDGARILRIRSE